MPLDVVTEIEIRRPRHEVAQYTADPANATAWYERIESAEPEPAGPVGPHSRVRFAARFLGRRLSYVYEIREWVPGERLVMKTVEGPYAMETTYEWFDAAGGGTRMRLRNRGGPSGARGVVAPLMARAIRRANRQDLERLKRLLEAG